MTAAASTPIEILASQVLARLFGPSSIKPDRRGPFREREFETITAEIRAGDLPCFGGLGILEAVGCIGADPLQVNRERLLRGFRKTDSLDQPTAALRRD